MKNIVIIVLSALVLITPAYGHMEMLSVDDMMSSMMADQNVSTIKELNCSKTADSEFEELGDAVMDRMLNNEQLHAQMDNMMGGEDSATLRQMHTSMGKSWMGCGDNQMLMMTMMQMMGMTGQRFTSEGSQLAQVSLAISIVSLIAVIVVGIVIFNKLNEFKLSRRK